MIKVLKFWVPGHPKTKGSLRVLNSGRLSGRAVLQDTPASKRWRALVVYAAQIAMRGETQAWPLDGPVRVDVEYWLPVKDEAALIAQGAGDKDKLDRNIYDALQDAGVFANDSQVVDGQSTKAVAQGQGPGARIVVSA
jgi:Holliday junction resolvase RusA-like endonuclease